MSQSALPLPATTSPVPATAAPAADAPRLLDGTELIGQVPGSGLREPPYLVRRGDGQVVQLSRLLFVLAREMDGRHGLEAIAARAGAQLDLRITPQQVRFVAEEKLHPLGLVRGPHGELPALKPVDALLALRMRAGVVPAGVVAAIARVLRILFVPPIVAAALAGVVALDAWLIAVHGVGSGVGHVIGHPLLALAFFGTVIASLAFHELGHAGACSYGGARPGRIGIGVYLVWPVFFTDVTDSYRLGKAGRLRTDLGGVYFNLLFGLAAAGAYAVTGFEPLLLVFVMQQVMVLDQFVPWVRLDGYHIVSDLIGVSDLFARIKPVLRSLVPGREPDRRVAELQPWARRAVTAWVLTTVAALSAGAAVIVLHAPAYLRQAWLSLQAQGELAVRGAASGHVADALLGGLGAVMLLMPVAGLSLTYTLVCRRLGVALAMAQARAQLTEDGASPWRP